MSRTTSLCFTKEGFVNPEALAHIERYQTDTVVIFGDGSQEAFDHIRNFDYAQFNDLADIAFAKTPLFEMRVVNTKGEFSNPHYLASELQRIKWICAKICAPFLSISISDITSHSKTKVDLDTKATETICYLGYYLWSLMKAAENHLYFPAVAIDRMTKHTYSLTPNTLDIELLRTQSGLRTLDYNEISDLLSITVLGEIYSVKLSVLNDFYGKFILPEYREMGGRNIRIDVSVTNSTGDASNPVIMSYGELGMLVEELQAHAYQKTISQSTPLATRDLLAYAKKVKINKESCVWPEPHQSLPEFLDSARDFITRSDANNESHKGDTLAHTHQDQPAYN